MGKNCGQDPPAATTMTTPPRGPREGAAAQREAWKKFLSSPLVTVSPPWGRTAEGAVLHRLRPSVVQPNNTPVDPVPPNAPFNAAHASRGPSANNPASPPRTRRTASVRDRSQTPFAHDSPFFNANANANANAHANAHAHAPPSPSPGTSSFSSTSYTSQRLVISTGTPSHAHAHAHPLAHAPALAVVEARAQAPTPHSPASSSSLSSVRSQSTPESPRGYGSPPAAISPTNEALRKSHPDLAGYVRARYALRAEKQGAAPRSPRTPSPTSTPLSEARSTPSYPHRTLMQRVVELHPHLQPQNLRATGPGLTNSWGRMVRSNSFVSPPSSEDGGSRSNSPVVSRPGTPRPGARRGSRPETGMEGRREAVLGPAPGSRAGSRPGSVPGSPGSGWAGSQPGTPRPGGGGGGGGGWGAVTGNVKPVRAEKRGRPLETFHGRIVR